MVDTRKLKAAMVEVGETQRTLAQKMAWSKNTVCAKINNKSAITVDEAKQMCVILGIVDPIKREEIFFA